MTRQDLILITVTDLATDFLYYDREEDEELGRGEIEAAIKAGELTVDQIVEQFRTAITLTLGSNPPTRA